MIGLLLAIVAKLAYPPEPVHTKANSKTEDIHTADNNQAAHTNTHADTQIDTDTDANNQPNILNDAPAMEIMLPNCSDTSSAQ